MNLESNVIFMEEWHFTKFLINRRDGTARIAAIAGWWGMRMGGWN